MIRLIIVFLLFFPSVCVSQYSGFLKRNFFDRQPSARAEAMGKGAVSIDGDLTTAFYNPAGAATLIGLEINYASAAPFYSLKNAKYEFLSFGIKFHKYLTLGV